MDHMQAIRAFARVVETGGFTRAADSLQMPNATVSKQIQQLERHLAVKLLERTTRRVRVTSDGAAYYERVRHLLAELDEIEATLGRAQTRPRGRLRVDTGGSTASSILIPAFPEFRARYPEIQLQLGVTDRTVDLIGENIDCAIRSTVQDPALIARRIGLLPWTLCASSGGGVFLQLQRHRTTDRVSGPWRTVPDRTQAQHSGQRKQRASGMRARRPRPGSYARFHGATFDRAR
jgi:DNA-binding transcriptional LysR family regulator